MILTCSNPILQLKNDKLNPCCDWLLTTERFQAAHGELTWCVSRKGGAKIKKGKPFFRPRGVIKVYWRVLVVGLVWSNGKKKKKDSGRKSNTRRNLYLIPLVVSVLFFLIGKSPSLPSTSSAVCTLLIRPHNMRRDEAGALAPCASSRVIALNFHEQMKGFSPARVNFACRLNCNYIIQ